MDYIGSYGPEPFSIINAHGLDLLTPKSTGHILDTWGASVWSVMIIGGLQSQLWPENPFQSSMPLSLWTPKSIGYIHPWHMESKCMKFHDHRWITELAMVRKPFTINHDLDLWPFDIKINRAHPWLMRSKCMKFHYYISKGIWLIARKQIFDTSPPAHRTSD